MESRIGLSLAMRQGGEGVSLITVGISICYPNVSTPTPLLFPPSHAIAPAVQATLSRATPFSVLFLLLLLFAYTFYLFSVCLPVMQLPHLPPSPFLYSFMNTLKAFQRYFNPNDSDSDSDA